MRPGGEWPPRARRNLRNKRDGLLAPKQHFAVEIGNVQIGRAALQFIQPVEQIGPRGGKILDVGAGQNPQQMLRRPNDFGCLRGYHGTHFALDSGALLWAKRAMRNGDSRSLRRGLSWLSLDQTGHAPLR